jgi:hypothetical protein
MKKLNMAKFRFISRISIMGKDEKADPNKLIWISKEFHKEIEKFEGKQIRIIIDDEI